MTFNIKKKNLTDLTEIFKDLKNPVCIQGMPGIADVGKLSVDNLVKNLKAQKIMDIIFDDYPAGAIINESLLYVPKVEVYFWKDPEEKNDIFLITADAQPMSPRGIYALSEYISDLLAEFQVTQVLTLGAQPVEKINLKGPRVYVTATSQELLEKFEQFDHVEKIGKGVVLGVNGLVPTFAKRNHDIDGVVLLCETNGFQAMNGDSYDIRASIKLLEVLNQKFVLPIDAEYSESKIQGLEAKLGREKEILKKELGISKKESNVNLDLYC
ncbi:MAG: PAC2 family protein [Candidatus Helarchaeota archaeon]